MKAFDEAFVEAAIERLAALAPDTVPRWGKMRPPQLLAHLTTAVRYSLNKEPLTPREWGWIGQYIAKPIFLSGLPKPRGLQQPKLYDAAAPVGTPDALREEGLDFIRHHSARSLDPPAHPVFGPMSLDEWARLHRHHFDHHLGQFGIKL